MMHAISAVAELLVRNVQQAPLNYDNMQRLFSLNVYYVANVLAIGDITAIHNLVMSQ